MVDYVVVAVLWLLLHLNFIPAEYSFLYGTYSITLNTVIKFKRKKILNEQSKRFFVCYDCDRRKERGNILWIGNRNLGIFVKLWGWWFNEIIHHKTESELNHGYYGIEAEIPLNRKWSGINQIVQAQMQFRIQNDHYIHFHYTAINIPYL